ncbi:unnamed protein product [Adineta steineri]|uniref:Uncharacterized protein n=1 Tax=Adineta steineri TaxID=433720 RepID=A0A819ZZY4_9BILA|nr:unnamed protein product [Adineta steineri]CAF4182004.1 unnamed protein product [Adineta steineri]
MYQIPVSCSVLIPFIDNVTLVPISSSNNITVNNQTCNECLCTAESSYQVLNCFPNNTCQFFDTAPQTYRIQATAQGRLYFPQQILPNASSCCMPDLNLLLSKLRNAISISVNVSSHCLAFDNHGFLVTTQSSGQYLYRYHPTHLTLIDSTLIVNGLSLQNMVYYNQAYYVGVYPGTILMINSNNLTTMLNITSSYINNPRDIMLLNNGRILIVASTGNNKLIFFNQSNIISSDYSLFYQQTSHYVNPHGMWPINDTAFYVTSWASNTVSLFTANSSDSISWTETLMINAQPIVSSSGGNHITIDECDRRWFSLGLGGILIFDNNGSMIGNFSFPNAQFFDMLITDNYIMYFSDILSNRIVRLDPNITCNY